MVKGVPGQQSIPGLTRPGMPQGLLQLGAWPP